jgi:acyl-CoA synthetase (AMP-forming)/AMP-acid ligase II/thioesterase domain-containing protein
MGALRLNFTSENGFQARAATFFEMVEQVAACDPTRIALICQGLQPLTYGELDLAIKEVGRSLLEAGISRGSHVAIALPDGPESVLIGIAVAANAAALPIHPKLTPREVSDHVKSGEIDAIILPAWVEHSKQLARLGLTTCTILASRARHSLLDVKLELLSACDRGQDNNRPLDGNVAALFKSVQQGGMVTFVGVSHESLRERAELMRTAFKLTSNDRCGCILPIRHSDGLGSAVLSTLCLGGSVALPAANSVLNIAAWVWELDPTWIMANSTSLVAALLVSPARDRPVHHSLRFIVSQSGSLSQSSRSELEAILGVPILECYSDVETGIITANPPPPLGAKSGTHGKSLIGNVVVADSAGKFLPPGNVGEILLRRLYPGVHELDAVEARIENEERWLHTGDFGAIDDEGFLTVTGRSSSTIRRGFDEIGVHEVEDALLAHPSVREAAAFGMPDDAQGEEVVALVVLKPGVSATVSQISDYLVGRIAQFKLPRRLLIVENLPKDKFGDLHRPRLSEPANGAVIATPKALDPLEVQILSVWQSLLHRSDIGLHDDFFAAGGDSLLATSMVLEVESIIKQTIPHSALRDVFTVRQFADAIRQIVPSRDESITCARDGSGLPFFYCHGDIGGRGLYALGLADLVDSHGSFYLLHPSTSLEKISSSTIEELASAYLPKLLRIHPDGPFQLGGFCQGGLIAWELAHQLTKLGRKVNVLILIDAISLNAHSVPRFFAKALHLLPGYHQRHASADYVMSRLWNLLERLNRTDAGLITRALSRAGKEFTQRVRSDEIRVDELLRAYTILMSNYVPPKLGVDIYCLMSEEARDQYRWARAPWMDMGRDFSTDDLSGDHLGCVTVHANQLASLLRQKLNSGPKFV